MSFVVVCIYNVVTFHDRGKGKGGRVHLNPNQGIKSRPLCFVFLDALASLETTQVSQSVSQPVIVSEKSQCSLMRLISQSVSQSVHPGNS